jgi:hypothetical protein
MISTLRRYVPTVALLILLSFFLHAGWLAIPAIVLVVQVLRDRPGPLLRTMTGRDSLRH